MNFVFDLDGTLCFQGRPISEKLTDSLRQLKKAGHHLFFASARPIRDMHSVIPEEFYSYGLIGANGSLISQDQEIRHTSTLPAPSLEQIKTLLSTYQATYLADSYWDYSYTAGENHPLFPSIDVYQAAQNLALDQLDPVVKILILSANNLVSLHEELSALPLNLTSHQNEEVIDINPIGINKWEGLKSFDISPGQFIAFGNDTNDIPLFQNAQHSIMIGDHSELSTYATEKIPLSDTIENQLSNKILSFI